jgi:hypothetical protein
MKEGKVFTKTLQGSIGPRIGKLAGVWILGMLAVTFAISGLAQVSTASLNGAVMDNMGALVPGAKIVMIQTLTNFTKETVSRPDGSFSVPSIPVGPYVIRISKEGFSNYEP